MSAVAPALRAPAPEAVREATREILARAEFTEPSRWYEILFQILRAIKEWLDALGAWAEANPTTARVLFIIAVIVLIGCLVHLGYLVLADVIPFGGAKKRKARERSRWEILQGTASDWREALQVARARLAEGDVRRAVWIAHRVLLGLLDEQGAIQFSGWKTNSHYLRECASGHPWYATFAALTALYENTVYASRPAPAAEAAALLGRVDQLYKGVKGAP
jgi:hypothetical protein